MNSAVRNFYKLIPDSLRPKYRNPHFKAHQIEVPFRMLVVGNSGSMKTNWVLNLIATMDSTFDHIVLCTRNADEPLYNFLKARIPPGQLTIAEGMSEIPALETFVPGQQYLVIFDDLCLEKNQAQIAEYFIRGRKVAGGVSCIYISQSYFKIPKTVRINASYIVLKKLSSGRDLHLILNEYNLGMSRRALHELYLDITKVPEDGLLIDVTRQQFRRNFSLIHL